MFTGIRRSITLFLSAVTVGSVLAVAAPAAEARPALSAGPNAFAQAVNNGNRAQARNYATAAVVREIFSFDNGYGGWGRMKKCRAVQGTSPRVIECIAERTFRGQGAVYDYRFRYRDTGARKIFEFDVLDY